MTKMLDRLVRGLLHEIPALDGLLLGRLVHIRGVNYPPNGVICFFFLCLMDYSALPEPITATRLLGMRTVWQGRGDGGGKGSGPWTIVASADYVSVRNGGNSTRSTCCWALLGI